VSKIKTDIINCIVHNGFFKKQSKRSLNLWKQVIGVMLVHSEAKGEVDLLAEMFQREPTPTLFGLGEDTRNMTKARLAKRAAFVI